MHAVGQVYAVRSGAIDRTDQDLKALDHPAGHGGPTLHAAAGLEFPKELAGPRVEGVEVVVV